jgi:hypothetical protein
MVLKSIAVCGLRPAPRARAGAAVGLTLACALALGPTPAAAEAGPQRVDATYRISFSGIDIGKFAFRASIDGGTYAAEGDARVSALLGAFKWQGVTRSSGSISALGPRPQGYTFDFNGTTRTGSIKLGFNQGDVTSISVVPAKPPGPGTVPVQPVQLKSVLDPLSAVLAVSRTANANPCGRRIPIFDGKQRFDLIFTFVRQQAVAEQRPSGQPGIAYVCRVRYLPIAGHSQNAEARFMASNSGIEVALRPVPSAGLFVPYQISIPTMAGTATLTSEQINIATRREQIALKH